MAIEKKQETNGIAISCFFLWQFMVHTMICMSGQPGGLCPSETNFNVFFPEFNHQYRVNREMKVKVYVYTHQKSNILVFFRKALAGILNFVLVKKFRFIITVEPELLLFA